jgi:hypothetical protein
METGKLSENPDPMLFTAFNAKFQIKLTMVFSQSYKSRPNTLSILGMHTVKEVQLGIVVVLFAGVEQKLCQPTAQIRSPDAVTQLIDPYTTRQIVDRKQGPLFRSLSDLFFHTLYTSVPIIIKIIPHQMY